MNTFNTPWPAADLENVPTRPPCGARKSMQLYDKMTDRVFGTSPGIWSLKRCVQCGSAYLDPRPTQASITRAYAGHFTHSSHDHPTVRSTGRLGSMLNAAINGYQNHRYGVKRAPASKWGRWAIPLAPSLRSAADTECRHLPQPQPHGRLLDVGCGNGGFLTLAQQAGWEVEGLDFDAAAVRTATSRGLSVRLGGLEVLKNLRDCYDVITLSHVVEHVYDPTSLLCGLRDLLKPGGSCGSKRPTSRA